MFKKNKDNLFDDQDLLKELFQRIYNIRLVLGVLSIILLSIKNQMNESGRKKSYQKFKKFILSSNPKTLEQYADALLEKNENPSW